MHFYSTKNLYYKCKLTSQALHQAESGRVQPKVAAVAFEVAAPFPDPEVPQHLVEVEDVTEQGKDGKRASHDVPFKFHELV